MTNTIFSSYGFQFSLNKMYFLFFWFRNKSDATMSQCRHQIQSTNLSGFHLYVFFTIASTYTTFDIRIKKLNLKKKISKDRMKEMQVFFELIDRALSSSPECATDHTRHFSIEIYFCLVFLFTYNEKCMIRTNKWLHDWFDFVYLIEFQIR